MGLEEGPSPTANSTLIKLPNGQAPGRQIVEKVEISDLSFGYSPRSTPIDQAHVRALAEVIDQLPPIVVERDQLAVVDGAHRVAAFEFAGRGQIPAIFFAGGTSEALVLAVQANVTHGKPLTRAERQAAAAQLLRAFPDRSDRWFGDVCGLSHSTVAKIRRDVAQGKVAVRTGRDGRRRPLDAASGRARAEQAIADMPGASIRTVAAAAGVAAATAKRAAAARETAERATPPQSPHPNGSATGGLSEGDEAARPSRSDLEDFRDWLNRTDVSCQDLDAYLQRVPLGRLYEFADECRKRSRAWNEMAGALEQQARRRNGHSI
jgi:ParB-like chromosome segregation protein Spo0J